MEIAALGQISTPGAKTQSKLFECGGSEAPCRFGTPVAVEKRCRRCALPPQSKILAANLVIIQPAGTGNQPVK